MVTLITNQLKISALKSINNTTTTPNQGDITYTVKIKWTPVNDFPFVAREDQPGPGGKYWNRGRNLYLIPTSVWYDLHNREGEMVFRLPSYINVDAGGNPEILEKFGKDIQWQWADDFTIIGLPPVLRTHLPVKPLSGMEAEFPELLPDLTRVYMYDVRKIDVVYEIVPPETPRGFMVRIESLSGDGYASLAAVSSKAYDRGDDLKNDPNHYKYLGVYSYKK